MDTWMLLPCPWGSDSLTTPNGDTSKVTVEPAVAHEPTPSRMASASSEGAYSSSLASWMLTCTIAMAKSEQVVAEKEDPTRA